MRARLAAILLSSLLLAACDSSPSSKSFAANDEPTCEITQTCEPGPAVPEPDSLVLGVAGLLVIRWSLRRRSRPHP